MKNKSKEPVKLKRNKGQSLPLYRLRQCEGSLFSPHHRREAKAWEVPGKADGEDIWDRALGNRHLNTEQVDYHPLPWKDSQQPTVYTFPNLHPNQGAKSIFSGEFSGERGRGEVGHHSSNGWWLWRTLGP